MARIPALLLLLVLLPAPAVARTADCEALAEEAARAEGIPAGLLAAISRVETGRSDGNGAVRAWPWTLNQGGQGSYLDSRAEAEAKLMAVVAGGVTNVDVGCMQLNWKWHAQAFTDASHMMDPYANTAYAARFLRALHDQLGDWDAATRAYHSMDPERGAAYQRKVATVLQGGIALAEAGGAAPPPDTADPGREVGLLRVAATPLVSVADRVAAETVALAVTAEDTGDWANRLKRAEDLGHRAGAHRLVGRQDEVAAIRAAMAELP